MFRSDEGILIEPLRISKRVLVHAIVGDIGERDMSSCVVEWVNKTTSLE